MLNTLTAIFGSLTLTATPVLSINEITNTINTSEEVYTPVNYGTYEQLTLPLGINNNDFTINSSKSEGSRLTEYFHVFQWNVGKTDIRDFLYQRNVYSGQQPNQIIWKWGKETREVNNIFISDMRHYAYYSQTDSSVMNMKNSEKRKYVYVNDSNYWKSGLATAEMYVGTGTTFFFNPQNDSYYLEFILYTAVKTSWSFSWTQYNINMGNALVLRNEEF